MLYSGATSISWCGIDIGVNLVQRWLFHQHCASTVSRFENMGVSHFSSGSLLPTVFSETQRNISCAALGVTVLVVADLGGSSLPDVLGKRARPLRFST